MKGDFSRFVFEPQKHYQEVALQQGRVLLDSDWNAAWMAAAARQRALLLDVVGVAGAPANDAGFAITLDQDQLTLGAGRYYVNGEQVQNDEAVGLTSQPFGPALPASFEAGLYVVYLTVWPRTVDALQDPRIREVALGGPDTTVRVQPVWQVNLAAVAAGSTCADFGGPSWTPPGYVPSTGALQARVEFGTRVGNRLYLVEIHAAGATPAPPAPAPTPASAASTTAPQPDPAPAATPTFKWSRTNGSVVLGVVSWQADGTTAVVQVAPLGANLEASLRVGDWVEFVDDPVIFQAQALPLWQVASLDPVGSRVTLVSSSSAAPVIDPATHPLLRRWDEQATARSPLAGGCVPVVPGAWIGLEDDIQVRFAPGAAYGTGDYWNFASRSALAGIEWPQAGGEPAALPKFGVYPSFAPLALASYDGASWSVQSDCRKLFPSLTTPAAGGGAAGDLAAQVQALQERVARLEAGLAGRRR